ncbi:MAG: hypothetical protein J1E35_01415 [Lachnospiraceae bacterium]|nr:hypothetical protein [Lachnospiraceae bacterium]
MAIIVGGLVCSCGRIVFKRDIIEKLKAWLSDLLKAYKSNSMEAKIARKYHDTLTEIQKVWDEAFEKAVKANQAMEEDAAESQSVKKSGNKKDIFSEGAGPKNDPSKYVRDGAQQNISDNSIPQSQDKSSVKFSERENIDLEAELATYNLDEKWNDYIGIQKNVIGKLRKEGFFEDNEVINKDSGMVIRITAKGIKETLGNGNRFQTLPKELKMLKVATIRSLPEIIQNGMLKEDNVANLHGENELFAYINSQAIVDGEEYGVRVSIKKKIGANLFWIHNIDCDKKSPELLNLRAQGRGNYETQDSEDSIQQSGEKVNINFSVRETEGIYDAVGELQRVQKENEKLRKDIERLRQKNKLEQTETKGKIPVETHIESVASYLLKNADSQYKKNSLVSELKEIYTYLKSEDVEFDTFMLKANDTAQRILAEARERTVSNDYAKEILSMLRNARVSLNDAQKSEAEYAYGKKWNRNYFGKVLLTNEGTPLDVAWKEWAQNYPDVFDADISDADMVTAVLDAYDSVKGASEIVEAYDKAEAVRAIATDIYMQLWNVSSKKSVAERYEEELLRVRWMSAKDKQTLKNRYEQEIKQLKYEHRIAMSELRKEKNQQIEKSVHDTREFYKQTIRNMKQKRDEEIRDIKEKSREYTQEYKERLEKKAQIDKITKNALKLNTWLVKNSQKEHVPEILKKPVAEVLKSLNFSSERLLGMSGGKYKGEPTHKDISLSKAFENLYSIVNDINNAQMKEETISEMYGHLDLPNGFVEFVESTSKTINDMLRVAGDNEYILNQTKIQKVKRFPFIFVIVYLEVLLKEQKGKGVRP